MIKGPEHAALSIAFAEAALGAKFALVGLIGFAIDLALLEAGMALGLIPAVARAISLAAAINVTFAINGARVFRCLTRRRLFRQWLGYMLTQGGGNLASYWLFVTLLSLHRGGPSRPIVALAIGSAVAYVVNFATARLIVFAKGGEADVIAAMRRAQMQSQPEVQPPPTSSSPVT